MHPYQSAMNTPLGNYQRNHLSNNSNVETVRYGGEATKKSSQNGNIRKNSVKQNKTNKNDREGYDDGYKVRTENKHRLYSARPSIDGCSNT